MYDYNMLTPGPSKVRKNVLEARAIQAGNSDLDPEFYDFYKRTCAKYSHFLNTANPSVLLSGEGSLGLEAACASLTEPGDRVLVRVSDDVQYYVVIRSIEKGSDDDSLPIREF